MPSSQVSGLFQHNKWQPRVESRLPLVLCCLQAASNCTGTHLFCVTKWRPAMRKPLPRQLLHSMPARQNE